MLQVDDDELELDADELLRCVAMQCISLSSRRKTPRPVWEGSQNVLFLLLGLESSRRSGSWVDI